MSWRNCSLLWIEAYIYIYTHTYEVRTISFQTFFVWAFKIVIDSWNFIVITIHLMRWLTNFYDFRFKATATAAIGIYPTKAWLSLLVNFKNAIWHFRRMICNKILFQTWKNATETTYGMLQTAFGASCMNWASVCEWHKRFKEGRESVRYDERCRRSKEVNRPELIGLRVKVTMLRF